MPYQVGVMFTNGSTRTLVIGSNELTDAFAAAAEVVDDYDYSPAAIVAAKTKGYAGDVLAWDIYTEAGNMLQPALEVGRARLDGRDWQNEE